ncbi:MAG: hypothetical protein KBD00_05885 [Candidatus Peribacteraceae bacterium]|nr:hypothetical protein [Candidatus Peribacteraceae bacterium]
MSDSPTPPYNDHDLVYVDPESRTVVGKVEFTKTDKPKSMPYVKKEEPVADGKPAKRGGWMRKYYPFGTYKSMKKIYRLDGKGKEAEPNRTLEEVMPKALKEVFWNDEKPTVAPETSL